MVNAFFTIEKQVTAHRNYTLQEAAPISPHYEYTPMTGKQCGWGSLKEGQYLHVSVACDELPNGFYKAEHTSYGITVVKQDIQIDQLVYLPDSQSDVVLKEITLFKERKQAFHDRGLLHKRGILLWGPPGSGKTCTIQMLLDLLVNKHGGIALQVEQPQLAADALQMIRKVEPNRQIVAILEDIDALVGRYGEAEYLALLDGEAQVDNIVYVGTTNYPERLDKRFTDRPSRFDTITWIGMPSEEARRTYLKAKETKWDEGELEYLISKSDKFSIAHLRELLILVKCMGYSKEDAVARISSMRFDAPSSEYAPDKDRMGFAA